ncbi:hypothetical protein PROFUN_00991 [Planoprotostelium fungivorum]|uniref:Uncharacterized protein n=1 Tax=Planoprotostelium fungivorum TaxID=1890364 RepID=A0A2P6N4E0_9EUKA|nr:hypothetical protein PROFUN_00991 [Planoprotostelium fungivorum]
MLLLNLWDLITLLAATVSCCVKMRKQHNCIVFVFGVFALLSVHYVVLEPILMSRTHQNQVHRHAQVSGIAKLWVAQDKQEVVPNIKIQLIVMLRSGAIFTAETSTDVNGRWSARVPIDTHASSRGEYHIFASKLPSHIVQEPGTTRVGRIMHDRDNVDVHLFSLPSSPRSYRLFFEYSDSSYMAVVPTLQLLTSGVRTCELSLDNPNCTYNGTHVTMFATTRNYHIVIEEEEERHKGKVVFEVWGQAGHMWSNAMSHELFWVIERVVQPSPKHLTQH